MNNISPKIDANKVLSCRNGNKSFQGKKQASSTPIGFKLLMYTVNAPVNMILSLCVAASFNMDEIILLL